MANVNNNGQFQAGPYGLLFSRLFVCDFAASVLRLLLTGC